MATQKGLLRFSDGRLRVYTTADGLSNDDLLTLFEDKGGALWIGTLGRGLNRFVNGGLQPHQFGRGLRRGPGAGRFMKTGRAASGSAPTAAG